MKVLVINGSPRAKGCTARALEEVIRTLGAEGIETELMQIGAQDIRGCLACGGCRKTGRCVIDDAVNEAADKLRECDGLLVGSPVYYASPNGTLLSFLDRLFHCYAGQMRMKVGAAVVSCRRGGAATAFDVLNKYFTICGMPVVSSSYWNSVHGFTAADVEKDLEGLQVMRNLGRNMAFLIRAIAAEKEKNGLPVVENEAFTSFPDGK
jgi:multimeric flavodoxin WrbA